MAGWGSGRLLAGLWAQPSRRMAQMGRAMDPTGRVCPQGAPFLVGITTMVLRVWSQARQHQCHLKACEKCTFPGSTTDSVSTKLSKGF